MNNNNNKIKNNSFSFNYTSQITINSNIQNLISIYQKLFKVKKKEILKKS